LIQRLSLGLILVLSLVLSLILSLILKNVIQRDRLWIVCDPLWVLREYDRRQKDGN
jgi:hypothetical protein